MNGNPLDLGKVKGGGRKFNECPDGYSSPQKWCDWRNREMARNDIHWVVGPSGTPVLVDREDWSAAHARAEEAQKETERRKFNHRLTHPIRSE